MAANNPATELMRMVNGYQVSQALHVAASNEWLMTLGSITLAGFVPSITSGFVPSSMGFASINFIC